MKDIEKSTDRQAWEAEFTRRFVNYRRDGQALYTIGGWAEEAKAFIRQVRDEALSSQAKRVREAMGRVGEKVAPSEKMFSSDPERFGPELLDSFGYNAGRQAVIDEVEKELDV